MTGNEPKEKIAIVGGGITGLFCAHILALNDKSIDLFEMSERVGGRIRTIRLDKDNNELTKDTWNKENLDFYVEFGPMRIELDRQLLLKALLDYLKIGPKASDAAGSTGPYLVGFSKANSPSSPLDPKYELGPEEIGKSPLELLQLAFLRIVVRLNLKDGEARSTFENKKTELVNTLADATPRVADPKWIEVFSERMNAFSRWMKDLKDEDFWDIQTLGHVEDIPLYKMGFWNLLSDHLSHAAVTKIRDLGTFYHLLPENPNAAEWLVWWLRGHSENLQGIFGGMECIVDKLTEKIAAQRDLVTLHKNREVTALKKSEERTKLQLCFIDKHSQLSEHTTEQAYDRVILALPKCAQERIVIRSGPVFEQEKEILGLLDSVIGFPMVKGFLVVKNPWWKEDRTNWYATGLPTRELHFTMGKTENSEQGLIMMYTDRPASSFWANYVPPGPQTDANRSRFAQPDDPRLPKSIEGRLKKKAVQYIQENAPPREFTAEQLVWYGIRDWRRKPYGGANHAWRPERRYWVVMRRLADIAVAYTRNAAASKAGVHICGEAYSDYHGFLEGSLRSAVYVLHRILDKNSDNLMPWLKDESAQRGLPVTNGYLNELREWAKQLDAVKSSEPYIDDEAIHLITRCI